MRIQAGVFCIEINTKCVCQLFGYAYGCAVVFQKLSALQYFFYTEDQRGSTVNVLDKERNEVVSYWYNDFGDVNEIQYTGGICDEMTRLLYLNAKYYDPSKGRFIRQDTYRGNKKDL